MIKDIKQNPSVLSINSVSSNASDKTQKYDDNYS